MVVNQKSNQDKQQLSLKQQEMNQWVLINTVTDLGYGPTMLMDARYDSAKEKLLENFKKLAILTFIIYVDHILTYRYCFALLLSIYMTVPREKTQLQVLQVSARIIA